MTMTLQDIVHEFHRKYDGTYILTKPGKDREPVLAAVQGIRYIGEGNNARGEIILNTKEYGKLQYNIPSNQQLIFRQIKAGVYQYGANAHVVARSPRRQWRRGICAENTLICNLSHLPITGAFQPVPYSLALIQAMFDRQSVSLIAALEMLKSGKFGSVAVEDNWGLVLPTSENPDNQNYLLYFRFTPVCYITPDGRPVDWLAPQYTAAVQTLTER